MSCSDAKPIFFQRQPTLPLTVQRFLRTRLEAALHDPKDRRRLIWPTVLGAPKIRQEFPDGLPEALLFDHAAKMLQALGGEAPECAWREDLAADTGTAEQGATGWKPHPDWGQWGPLVSLRSGVALSALSELAADERYGLLAALALFNSALFHETHDALESLWKDAAGNLRQGLQGLILMTAGYHHLQLQNRKGMQAVWEDSLDRLEPFDGRLDTPWGAVDHRDAVQYTEERMECLTCLEGGEPEQVSPEVLEAVWALPAPRGVGP